MTAGTAALRFLACHGTMAGKGRWARSIRDDEGGQTVWRVRINSSISEIPGARGMDKLGSFLFYSGLLVAERAEKGKRSCLLGWSVGVFAFGILVTLAGRFIERRHGETRGSSPPPTQAVHEVP